jgi:hypothetical protein
VEIATKADHRVLAYLWALTRRDIGVADWAVNAYAARDRGVNRPPLSQNLFKVSEAMAALAGLGAAETTTDRFLALGWIKSERRFLKLTDLGRAVLDEMNERETTVDDPLALVIKPDDPVAYARVIEQIATQEDVLLVDSYLTAESLALLLGHTPVRRFLTSNKGPNGKARVASLAAVLATVVGGEKVEIRLGTEHDRYVIPGKGPIQHLGTSLNGVGKHLSVMTFLRDPVAAEIRRLMEAAWSSASVLKTSQASAVTDSAAVNGIGSGVRALDVDVTATAADSATVAPSDLLDGHRSDGPVRRRRPKTTKPAPPTPPV